MTVSPVPGAAPRPDDFRMTDDEVSRALRAQGVSERSIAREMASRHLVAAIVTHVETAPPLYPFPVRLVLPWSALCSDDARGMPVIRRGTNGHARPMFVLTPEYKAARAKVSAVARAAMTVDGYHFPPLTGDLRFVAWVTVPDRRVHDVVNFAKGVQDALSKIVYRDDAQLCDARWVKAGVNVDAPGAVIEIAPCAGGAR